MKGRRVSLEVSLPAPVKGWNARDPWPEMDRAEAIQLDNMFPEFDGVRLRRGYDAHATGTGSVLTLHSYRYGALNKLLAFSNGNIWDVTSTGAATSLDSTVSTGIWSVLNFGPYAIMVNGTDTPRKYDGTAVTTTTYTGTGLTPEGFVGVSSFKNRLFFWEANSLAFWYGGTQNIAGNLEKFDLSYIAALGGKITALGTWSIDAGDGIDDVFVIILSSGQILIYQGTDPGDANAWALNGIFQIGEPISERGLVKFGGDLVIMTADGYTPLSRALPLGRTNNSVSISDKISGAVKEAVRINKNSTGWQAIQYPKGGYLLFNVPTGIGGFDQHIMNTSTGAWCRFTNQPAQCWAVHSDNLYFGAANGVYRADSGTADNGADIQFDARTAFSQMAAQGRQKRWTMVRPVMRISGQIPLSIRLSIDYGTVEPSAATTSGSAPGAIWDVAIWDVDFWGPPFTIRRNWETVSGIGYTASAWIRGKTSTQEIALFSFDYILEPGGFL